VSCLHQQLLQGLLQLLNEGLDLLRPPVQSSVYHHTTGNPDNPSGQANTQSATAPPSKVNFARKPTVSNH
jgi:hypothetical protein